MTTLLLIAFVCGFVSHIVVKDCQEFRHKRRQEKLHKRAEQIKKEAALETLKFIQEMGGDAFIEQCEKDMLYDTVPLDTYGATKPPKIYVSRLRVKPNK